MKSNVLSITALAVVSFSALEFSIVPPLAAAQSASLNNTCSRLLWIGEDNVFGLDEQVFVAEADGRNRTRISVPKPSKLLANRFFNATWLPDGRVAMYDANAFDQSDVSWIIDADGTGLLKIPEAASLAVAPNGRKLAAHGFRGIEVFRPNGKVIGSYTVDGESFNLSWASTNDAMAWVDFTGNFTTRSLVLADGLAQNTTVLASGDVSPTFSWSPDGSTIAWSDASSISLANEDGSNPSLIWSNSGQWLRWSPDGSRLAWVDGSSIMLADADGSNATAITSTAGFFKWSPDSRSIVWFDGEELQLVNATGGAPVVLPSGNNVEYGVRFDFSPDGTRLAWTTDDEIWISNGDGTEALLSLNEFDGSEFLGDPAWSPDSAVFAVDTYSDIVVSNADGSVHKRILSSHPSEWFDVSLRDWSPCIFTPLGASPANDQFANAEYLNGASQALASGSTFTVNGTTVEATADGDEPSHLVGAFGQPFGPRTSIWYRWTADIDQIVEVDTVGSEVGTVLVAYTGATQSELEEVAKGSDNVREITRIRFAARAGETYHFVVDGYDGNSEGTIQLNVRQPTMDLAECTITGTNGPEILTGTTGPDVLCGLGGDDEIRGLGGADVIFAGSGDDFVSAGGGNDIVFGENGKDQIVGGSGNDLLSGGLLGDQLFGGKGNDIVFGSSGADRLFGSAGNDELFGEMGGDELFGGDDNDYLDGGRFNDTCMDSDGDNTLLSCE